MDNDRPSLSVCVPVYNSPRDYLKAALESVLSQAGPFSLEVVVSDDASGCDYQETVEELRDSRIKYFRNKENHGMVGNWNAAVRRSSGTLAMVLGHDDLLTPYALARFVTVFMEHGQVVLCGSGREFIGGNGELRTLRRAINDRRNIFRKESVYLLASRETVQLCLRNGNVIGEPSCVMFRRDAFDRVGGYDSRFQHAADLDFNLRMSACGMTAYLRDAGARRRIHGGNLTRANAFSGVVRRERTMMFERHRYSTALGDEGVAHGRAYLVRVALRDLLKALWRGRLGVAASSGAVIARYLRWTPLEYWQSVMEMAQGRNLDER